MRNYFGIGLLALAGFPVLTAAGKSPSSFRLAPTAQSTPDLSAWTIKLLAACRQREATAQEMGVAFAKYQDDHSDLIEVGLVQQEGGFEKWVVQNVVRTPDWRGEQCDPHELFSLTAPLSNPKVTVFDGTRYLSLVPPQGSKSGTMTLDGILSVGFDSSFRAGALHCGFLFAERWLSDFLRGFVVERAQVLENDRTRLYLKDAEGSDQWDISVDVDDDGFLYAIQNNFDGEMSSLFSVDSSIVIEGVRLPSSGTLKYAYGLKTPWRVRLAYDPALGGIPATERDLMVLPSEYSEEGYRAKILDMSAGQFFELPLGAGPVDAGAPSQEASLQLQSEAADMEAGGGAHYCRGYSQHGWARTPRSLVPDCLGKAAQMSAYLAGSRPFIIAFVLAIGWPFVFLSIPDDEIAVRVAPSRNVVLASARRGEIEEFKFRVENRSRQDVSLSLGAQSCSCISISISDSLISSGASSVLTARGRTPITGVSRNSFNLIIREHTDGDVPALERTLLLSYAIEALQQEALEVYPPQLALSPSAWKRGGRHVLTLRARDQETPRDIFIGPGVKTGIDVEIYGDWVSDANGIYSRRCCLLIPPQSTALPMTEVELCVKTASGALISKSLQFTLTDL